MNLGSRYSQHSFSQIPAVNQARSVFDRSFTAKDTWEFDYLTPVFIDEVLPGDTINLNLTSFCRLASQYKPIMDNMYLDFYFFFVPNRLVWDNWEKFNGAQDNPSDSTSYTIPQIVSPAVTGFESGSIMDHWGLPVGVVGYSVSALPFRGMYLIWNQWFRDQNLQNSLTVYTDDGPDLYSDYILQKANKKHDYFTSALPWAQKGTASSLPTPTATVAATGDISWKDATGARTANMQYVSGPPDRYTPAAGTLNTADVVRYNSGLGVTLSTTTVNEFRQSIMVQSLLELDARGGTRYVEILRAHFGVISPDFRLQRPELLSASTTMLQQHVVAQTSASEAASPQANLSAFSTSSTGGQKVGFSKSFVEHGYVHGYVVARGENTYQQGVNRMWSRSTRYDFFWPKLQELGEQTILNKELYVQGTGGGSADSGTFGYQERYAEYRYHPSEIRGQFRSSFSESLDIWHLAAEFGALPTLNTNWIALATPMERVLVTPVEPENADAMILADMFFNYKHARPMMTYGVPASLGRF